MQYLGGKSRISKQISEILNEVPKWEIEYIKKHSNNNCQLSKKQYSFVSLFCGGCSVEGKVKGYKEKILNDKHEYSIEMLKGVQNGYELPEIITEENYRYIKDHKDEDKVLAGFVGFGCSFGGKWFDGYARNKEGYNYALISKNSLLRNMKGLMDAKFLCKDYRDVELPKHCIIYADPPIATQLNIKEKNLTVMHFGTT